MFICCYESALVSSSEASVSRFAKYHLSLWTSRTTLMREKSLPGWSSFECPRDRRGSEGAPLEAAVGWTAVLPLACHRGRRTSDKADPLPLRQHSFCPVYLGVYPIHLERKNPL